MNRAHKDRRNLKHFSGFYFSILFLSSISVRRWRRAKKRIRIKINGIECKFLRVQFLCCRWLCSLLLLFYFIYHLFHSLFICTCHIYTHLMTWQVLYPASKKWENSIKSQSQAKPDENKDNSQSRKIKHVVRDDFLAVRPFMLQHIHNVLFTYGVKMWSCSTVNSSPTIFEFRVCVCL